MLRRRPWLAASLVGLVLAGAAAEIFVPGLIRAAHRGEGLPAVERILEGRAVHPVEDYLARWRAAARPTLAVLALLWVLCAIALHPSVEPRLARWLRPLANPGRLDPLQPPPARRRLVAALAFGIAAGSLTELALDPPERREHWPFSQYPMYSKLPGSSLLARRLYGLEAGSSGREIPLWDDALVYPFDHSRLWFSWDRLDRSPERERVLPAALRDCLERYESRRARGLHDGPRLSAVRLYRVRWNATPDVRASERVSSRELVWEVTASTP